LEVAGNVTVHDFLSADTGIKLDCPTSAGSSYNRELKIESVFYSKSITYTETANNMCKEHMTGGNPVNGKAVCLASWERGGTSPNYVWDRDDCNDLDATGAYLLFCVSPPMYLFS